MNYYQVTGGNQLNGECNIKGGKNAVLPILAATILNKGESIIHNCPNIADTHSTIKILKSLGCDVTFSNNIITVNSKNVTTTEITSDLSRMMRSSIIFLGSVLGRFNEAKISYPGGCELGARPIDLHLNSFKQMGVNIEENNNNIICSSRKLLGATINLDFPSVGATENIMISAVLADGTTIIKNPAREPEIIDLEIFLNNMGANIKGSGTSEIVINGVKALHDVTHTVMPDRIVAGTLLTAAAMTHGEVLLRNVNNEHLIPIINVLEETGCKFTSYYYDDTDDFQNKLNDILVIAPDELKSANTIITNPHPAFPTDMQPQIVSLLSIANGSTIVKETLFESRYKHIEELNKMGAGIQIKDDNSTFVIPGSKILRGTTVESKDLRGGAALLLSGLVAEGETIVTGSQYIERGYEEIDKTLKLLGANINYVKIKIA